VRLVALLNSRAADDGSDSVELPATPLSRCHEIGGFASPPYDGFAFCSSRPPMRDPRPLGVHPHPRPWLQGLRQLS
jgi:hypothetical protein